MTRMRVRKLLRGTSLVVAIGLSIVLGACSSSGSGGNTGPAGSTPDAKPAVATPTRPSSSAGGTGQSTPAAAATDGEINVTLEDNTFPKEIRVKAGAKVVFVVSNKSDVEHSFEIPDFNLLHKIQAGQKSRIAWTVPDKKGKWDIGCFLTDPSEDLHEGMEGTLIIE